MTEAKYYSVQHEHNFKSFMLSYTMLLKCAKCFPGETCVGFSQFEPERVTETERIKSHLHQREN